MARELPTIEPPIFSAGETVAWVKTLDDYPASEWTLKYYLRGSGITLDITAVADGEDYEATISAADSAKLAAGIYTLLGRVENTDGEKHDVVRTTLKVEEDLATVSAAYDGRSKFKKILDAIDAIFEGKATVDQQQYTIGTAGSTRTLIRIPIPDLIELRKLYAAKVARENRKGKTNRLIFAQFD